MKLPLKKINFKPNNLFYVGFFAIYFAALYCLLYWSTGLGAFQINGHFFSNVIGSLSKRFLSEASVYGLIFYLLYYTKTHWKRIVLISLFAITFLINTLSIGYYFIYRSNWRPGSTDITPSFVVFGLLSILITIGVITVVIKLKNNSKEVWLFKKRLFIVLLLGLSILALLVPVTYSTHRSLVTTQEDVEKIFRVVHLETSGMTHFYEILMNTYQPMIVPDVSVFDFKEEGGIE